MIICMGASHEYQEIRILYIATDILLYYWVMHCAQLDAALSDLTLSVLSPKSAANHCIALVGMFILFLYPRRIYNRSNSTSTASDHTSQSSYPIVTCK